MKYQNFTRVEEFLTDEYFRDWVRFPDSDSNLFWKEFLDNHPNKIELVREAKEFLMLIEFDNSETLIPTEEESDSIQNAILAHEEIMPSEKTVRKNRLFLQLNKWRRFAAAACVLISLGLFSWKLGVFQNQPKSFPNKAVEWVAKETGKGQVLNFKLPDGSLVKLNRESKLIFPKKFDQNNRNLRLIGEAFFEVVEDPTRVFEVNTTKSKIVVFGTSFNVRAYADRDTRVALETGKVTVENIWNPGNTNVELLPGEMVVLDEKTYSFKKSMFEPEHEFAWKEGVLRFDGTPFEMVIQDLEWWYGVDIQVVGEDRQKKRKIHGRYKNSSLEFILKALVYYADIKDYEINGKEVTITL